MKLENYTEEQIRGALCALYHLTPEQLDTYFALVSQLNPWQNQWLKSMMDERHQDKQRICLLETMQAYDWGLGDKAFVSDVMPQLVLPRGDNPGWASFYIEERPDVQAPEFTLYARVDADLSEAVACKSSRAEAILAAMDLDRQRDPYRWRPLDETCPDQTMLLFACSDWAHTTELGKPVPVKTGYRNGREYRLWGASWKPTHWCYQPVGPQMRVEREVAEITDGAK